MASSSLKPVGCATLLLVILQLALAPQVGKTKEDGKEPQAVQESSPPGSLLPHLKGTSPFTPLVVNEEILREEYRHPAIGFKPRKLSYIVQDKMGAVIGRLKVSFEPLVESGRYVILLRKSYEFQPRITLEHTLNADDFSPLTTNVLVPRSAESEGGGENVKPAVQRNMTSEERQDIDKKIEDAPTEVLSSATYYYDTVTVRRRDYGSETFFNFRRLLPSYDINALDFLVHALDLKVTPPKSILTLVSPFDGSTHLCLLEKVERQVIYSAEGRKVVTELIRVTSEFFTEEYYVETTPPYSVIKFTAGEFKFTLYEEEIEEKFK